MCKFTKKVNKLIVFIGMVVCFQKLYSEPIPYELVAGRPEIYIDPASEEIGHTWANGSVWDKDLIRRFYIELKKHRDFFVMFDLGAQTGSFTLLSKYFPCSKWYAFEPLKEAANILEKNLRINNIDNVLVYQKAVSNFNGKVLLKIPDKCNWGLATIGHAPIRALPSEEREVDSVRLDDFVLTHQIDRVDFMKLDTEGSELAILKGAEKLIRKHKPIILMEYNEINMQQCGVLKEEVDQFLRSLGYEWKLISTEDILCMPL